MRQQLDNTSNPKLEVYDRGASMVEYALLLVLIAMIAFAAVQFVGGELSTTYSDIATEVQSAN